MSKSEDVFAEMDDHCERVQLQREREERWRTNPPLKLARHARVPLGDGNAVGVKIYCADRQTFERQEAERELLEILK